MANAYDFDLDLFTVSIIATGIDIDVAGKGGLDITAPGDWEGTTSEGGSLIWVRELQSLTRWSLTLDYASSTNAALSTARGVLLASGGALITILVKDNNGFTVSGGVGCRIIKMPNLSVKRVPDSVVWEFAGNGETFAGGLKQLA